MKKYFAIPKSRIIPIGCLFIVASMTLACTGLKRPWREYSPKPFSSQEWLAGDQIERGRMSLDLFKKRIPNGKSREEILEILGEADKKKTVEGKEVWFYKTDVGIMGALDNLPISFDDNKGAYIGVVTGSTISLGVKDEDL